MGAVDDIRRPAATAVREASAGGPEPAPRPTGLLDLRGRERAPALLVYPADAVLVVSGLPGSGKSTLIRRWSGAASVVDPRDAHEDCAAVMPTWLPYAVYRPWARLVYARRLWNAVRAGGPLLVHDCGSRSWLRRLLAREAGRRGRELHLVLLDMAAADALAGQEARGRWARPRVFDRHRRGLRRLSDALTAPGAGEPGGSPVPEAASVVLLDRTTREHVTAVAFRR